MTVIGYGKTAKRGPTLTKPVFPDSVDWTSPPSEMIENLGNAEQLLEQVFWWAHWFYFKNVHWKSDAVEKNSRSQLLLLFG